MKTEENQKSVMPSTVVYRLLIRAYPKAFREKFGPEMTQVFREQCADASIGSGRFGLTKLWLRTLFDFAKSCPSEHAAAFGGNIIMFKQTLLGRLWLAPTLALLTVGGVSATVSALLPKLYQSSARLQVDRPTRAADDLAGYDPYWIQTQFETLLSAPLLTQVIDKLSLSQRWAARYGSEAPLRKEDTLRLLRQHVDIRQSRNTHLIDIRVSNENPAEAAAIANEIATAFLLQSQVATQTKTVVYFVDQAVAGLRPIRPNVPFNTVVGGLFAAFAALLIVLVARLIRTRVAAVA